MKKKARRMTLLATCGLLALAATATNTALASDKEAEISSAGQPLHCISLIRLKNSNVLDNQHIVFETVGGKYYLNQLAYACPGLSRSEPFMYRTSLDQLCDLDIITVLDDYGFGLRPGASCGLSVFEPVTKAQVEGLKVSLEAAKKSRH